MSAPCVCLYLCVVVVSYCPSLRKPSVFRGGNIWEMNWRAEQNVKWLVVLWFLTALRRVNKYCRLVLIFRGESRHDNAAVWRHRGASQSTRSAPWNHRFDVGAKNVFSSCHASVSARASTDRHPDRPTTIWGQCGPPDNRLQQAETARRHENLSWCTERITLKRQFVEGSFDL